MGSLQRSHPPRPPAEPVAALPCALTAWCALNDRELVQPDAPLEAVVIQQVARCMVHARCYWADLPQPKVSFDLRGRSAGQAHFGRQRLRFNRTLLVAQPREFIEEVVPHEVAHWVDRYGLRSGGKPHGPAWKRLMVSLYGRVPNVTHTFDTTKSSPVPWHYGCACFKGHWLTTRRHRRIERGYVYRCRCCGQRLYALDCEPEA